MEVRVITDINEFFKLKDEWKILELNNRDITYYSTFDYNKAWIDVFGKMENINLSTICVYNNGKLIGIAPLVIEENTKFGIIIRTLKFLGKGDYFNFILDNEVSNKSNIIKEIFNVIENKLKFNKLELTHIDYKSQLSAYLLKSYEYNINFGYLVECPRININNYNSLEEYQKIIPSKTRKFSNKLQREVGYYMEVISTYDEDIYDEITQLHTKEQEYLKKDKGRTERISLYQQENNYQFRKNIYKQNNTVIFIIRNKKDNKIISYNMCYLYNRILYSWNSAYDPQYASYRLSKVRLYEIIKYMYETNIANVLDLGAGRYPWKFEWTNEFTFDYELKYFKDDTKYNRLLKKIYLLKKRF